MEAVSMVMANESASGNSLQWYLGASMNKTIITVTTLGLLLAVDRVTLAADVDYDLRTGAIYSDNVRRSATMEEDQTIARVGFGLTVDHKTRRFGFQLRSNLDYNHYLDNAFDNEVVGAASGDLNFMLVENLLNWVATDRFGKLQTDPFLPDTEANRGNFNSFATGPDLVVGFGQRMSLNIGARYRTDSFETRDTDNDTGSVSIALSRALSPNRSISISGTYQDVDYDDNFLNSDYEVRAAYLSFDSQISKGNVSVSIGANEVDIQNETLDGTLANVSFSRELTPRTSIRLDYDQRYSDSGDIFRRFQDAGFDFGDTRDIPGEGEPFESRAFSAYIGYDYGGNDYYFRASSDVEDYDSSNTLERRRNSFGLGVSRRLGGTWRVSASGRIANLDYDNVSREDDDLSISLGVSRQLSRTLYLDFRVRYVDRSSDSVGADYTENQYSISFRYDPE